jgi:hypothetical protein
MNVVSVEEVRSGSRIYGSFYSMDTGLKVYVAYRKYREIYRAGRKSISQAMREGVASWAIDVATLMEAKRRGCTVVCVRVTDRGSFYSTAIDNYLDNEQSRIVSHEGKGGSVQRVLPLHKFHRSPESFVL